MNRTDFQTLADARLADAEALLLAGRWAGAYYLLGYAMECALKACVARQFKPDDVPEKKLVNDFYTHDLEKLLVLAGLSAARDARDKAAPAFRVYWQTVCVWNEAARYNHSILEATARELYVAVTDPNSGVLPG